jgi:FtsZ-interacting cell division protein YlmF
MTLQYPLTPTGERGNSEKVGDPLPFEQLPSWFEHTEQRVRFSNPEASLGNLLGFHQISVVKPTSFDEGAQPLAKHFKRRQAVVLNLQQADAELTKRMVDFCAGLAYALDGAVHPIANSLFLLTPADVEVSDNEGSRTSGRKFYNQS